MEEYYICDHAESCKDEKCVNKLPRISSNFFSSGSSWNKTKPWGCNFLHGSYDYLKPTFVLPLLVNKKGEIGMKKEDVVIGMKVRCFRKSICEDSWSDIQKEFGNCPVGKVIGFYGTNELSIKFDPMKSEYSSYLFKFSDIGPTICDIPQKQEYEILRPITILKIYKEHPRQNEFLKLLETFKSTPVNANLPISVIIQNKVWVNWLITKGFLKEKEEKFYHIGQRFCCGTTEYILASLNYQEGLLINLKEGTRLTKNGVRVCDLQKITQEEFDKIRFEHEMTLIGE